MQMQTYRMWVSNNWTFEVTLVSAVNGDEHENPTILNSVGGLDVWGQRRAKRHRAAIVVKE
jgi:hypothetical protein